MLFIKRLLFGTPNKYDVNHKTTTFEVSFVCSSTCGQLLVLCSHPNYMATNLMDTGRFPNSYIKQNYGYRWAVEEYF